jgi:hypothetical protein
MSNTTKRKTLSQELVRELFTYEDGKLFWRKTGTGRKANQSAGFKRFNIRNKNFRWIIKYKGKEYMRSNLIWIYHHGEIPVDRLVDHRNPNNTLDDRLENLRLATHKENSVNRVKISNFKGKPTSSKYKGVSWYKRDNNWRAKLSVRKDGKRCYLHLGYFDTQEEAYAAYVAAAKLWHGDFFHTGFRADNA